MPWRETPAQLARARAEQPVKVPAPEGDLFGILTPPAPDAYASTLCAVHLTRPRSHRNRNWVEIARTLAARGTPAFRFDYHGTGDSGGASGPLNPGMPYRSDIAHVLRHLRERFGYRRFVLTGSCFDARTALSAFADEPDAIEALLFVAAPVTTLDDHQKLMDQRKDWGHLWRALQDRDNWRRLRDLDRWRHMANVLGRVALRGARESGESAADPPLDPLFLDHFAALARSRARALFVYGADDPEFLGFQIALREHWPALPAEVRERLQVEIWPGVVHSGFTEMRRQREIVARALEWLLDVVENDGIAGRARGPAEAGPARHRPEGAWTSA
jgi:pimeloyl-ACP methyl ester carboxylesterase